MHILPNYKTSLLIILLFCVALQTQSQSFVYVEEKVLLDCGLPLVEIESVNGELPTCDYVTHPEGAMGEGITNATKVPGRIIIKDKDSVVYDSGPYVQKVSGMTFRIRGNTSAYHERKPYKIKLQKKSDLLLRGNEELFADKDWLFIPTGPWIEMLVGFHLSQLMGLEWTPAMKYVNLTVNKEYRGVYAIVEQVEYNERCRIKVNKETGYIIERDPYWWNEDLFFSTPDKKEYTFKYPENEDITDEQLNDIQNNTVQMEVSIQNGTYEDFIDVNSWATWLLTQDILGTWDSGGSNIFLSKNDNTNESLLKMPCIWDFDTMTKMKNDWARIHYDSFYYFPQLFASHNSTFVDTYIEKWRTVSATVFSDMNTFLDSVYQSDFGESIRITKTIEEQAFNYKGSTFEQDINGFKSWFNSRKSWLTLQINDLSSPVQNIKNQSNSYSSQKYDLMGRRVNGQYRGIVILRDGRKIVRNAR